MCARALVWRASVHGNSFMSVLALSVVLSTYRDANNDGMVSWDEFNGVPVPRDKEQPKLKDRKKQKKKKRNKKKRNRKRKTRVSGKKHIEL